MGTIVEYVGSMLKIVMVALPVLIFIRFLWNKVKKSEINYFHEVGVVCLFSFLTGLFALTFDQDASDEQKAINIQPFKVFEDTFHAISRSGLWEPFAINLLGNILMFLPIGLLLPLLWKRFSIGKTIIMTFLISLFIEIVQLTLDRSSDIDDLWLNTLGGIIGYGTYKIVPLSVSKRFKL